MNTQPISRRSLAAGLALAPIAALPALAGAVLGDDPIFAALADLERCKARHAVACERHSAVEEVYFDGAPRPHFVVLDEMKFSEHEEINSHFDDPGMPDENIRAAIKKLLSFRKRQLTPEQQAEREAARQAAHVELNHILAADAQARLETGYDAAEAAQAEACGAEANAEREVIATEPTTKGIPPP